MDSRVAGFGICVVTDLVDRDPTRRGKTGKITFVLFARFTPGAAPTRRVIGVYGASRSNKPAPPPGNGAR